MSDFDYELLPSSIAQAAIEPRDASRLLLASDLSDHRFSDLPQLLRPGDRLVVNRTRVRAARLTGVRSGTGGAVEALLTRRVDAARWEALLRPARRLRAGTEIDFGRIRGRLLSDPERGLAAVELSAECDIDDLLPTVGELPLPPYFHGRLEDPERYQTMFAKEVGSAAAPTAALHFTPSLVERLEERGVGIAEIDLHVGLDTFRPMEDGELAAHVIHREWYEVGEATVEAVARATAAGGRVIAVGTTVVRALESAAAAGSLRATAGWSSLFIRPGYRRRVVDGLITNFHAPRTTLLALVAAFMGERWRTAYQHAVSSGYRFLSFGDAMFVDDPVPR